MEVEEAQVPEWLKRTRGIAKNLLVRAMSADLEEFVDKMSKNHDRLNEIGDMDDSAECMDEFVLRLAAEYAFTSTLLVLNEPNPN